MKPGGALGVLKDRRVQIAAAGAALLGLFALSRRGSGGGVDGDRIQPAAGFDSSGTDAYNAIQALGQAWQNDLRDFAGQLGDIRDQLDQRPNGGTGAQPGVQYPEGPSGWPVAGPIGKSNKAQELIDRLKATRPPGGFGWVKGEGASRPPAGPARPPATRPPTRPPFAHHETA